MNNFTKEEIQTIYNNYMILPFDKVSLFLNQLAREKNCAESEIKKEIDDYAKTMELQEFQKYLFRKKEIKNNNYKYVKRVIDLLDKMENEEELDFSIFKRNQPIEDDINKCISLFPKKKKELEELKRRVSDYVLIEIKKRKHIEVFVPDHRAMKNKSKYVYEIIDLLNFEKDLEAIIYMRDLQYTDKYFKGMIANFEAKFKNSDSYTPRLKELFNKYQEFIGNSNDEFKMILASRKKYLESVVKTVSLLIESGCSIEEFCHKHIEFDIKDIETCIKQLFSDKKQQKVKLIKEKNAPQQFIDEIKCIVVNIKSGNYDYMDYYMDTKLSFKDFQMITRKYGIYDKDVSIFVSKNIRNSIVINRENELNATNIISGRIITREEKIKIFAFLDENQIPVNLYSYKLAITKYLNGEIDIENKHYTKKV